MNDLTIGEAHFEFNKTAESKSGDGELISWQTENGSFEEPMMVTHPFRIGKTTVDSDMDGYLPQMENLIKTLPPKAAKACRQLQVLKSEWNGWVRSKGKVRFGVKKRSKEDWFSLTAEAEIALKTAWESEIDTNGTRVHVGFVLDILCHLIKRFYFPVLYQEVKSDYPHHVLKQKK